MANPQKIKAMVDQIHDYGNQVYKLILKTEKKFPRFKSGQFLHLTLDSFDPTTGYWPESRVFSISSCSEGRKEVSIVYSVKGIYTKKMEEQLEEGSGIWLKAPYGEFIIPNHVNEGECAVLIAGGTGVSPFIPFLKNTPERVDVLLNYGLRRIDLMIFKDELNEALARKSFSLNLFLESDSVELHLQGNVSKLGGKLNIQQILKDVCVEKSKFFISGPPVMIELFKQQLIESSVSEEKIIIDEWG